MTAMAKPTRAEQANDAIDRRTAHRERLARPTNAPLDKGQGRRRGAKARTGKTRMRVGPR
jgi:hypothetical protein